MTHVGACQNNLRVIEGLTLESTILEQDVKYSLILPEDYYSSNKKYPVVYLLHGLGDNESSWLEYGRVNQITDVLMANNEVVPVIFVMPQGYRTYYVNDFDGKFRYEDMFIDELIPHIDKKYRTMASKNFRATLGYSMGGFGALSLALQHPEVISVSVPLSMSMRTDEQYMTEAAPEWDEQWGKLFGAEGKVGNERLTDYYKEYSPFYIFQSSDLSKYSDLKLYIDNGDDEFTLARSNEELHMLLRDINFDHEFRVRDGGHDFVYWRQAFPNAMRFISDSFNGKEYRGDLPKISTPRGDLLEHKFIEDESGIELLLPEEFDITNRLYPVLYVFGGIDGDQKQQIAEAIKQGERNATMPPVILAFLNERGEEFKDKIIPTLEGKYRARNGYRFRALIGFGDGGRVALNYALQPMLVTSCAVVESPIDNEHIKNELLKNKENWRTWYYLASTDKSEHYTSNGNAHIFLRENKVYHEYRIFEDDPGNSLNIPFNEILDFTQKKLHR
jgi:enterochelin esterase-like enzyme